MEISSDSLSFQRQSDLSRRPFPFEAVHVDGPVHSMERFHWHEYLEISLVRQGSGVYEIEGGSWQVCAGDIVIINPVERHRVRFEDTDPLFETSIHFDSRKLWSTSDLPRFSNRPELGDDSALPRLFTEITEEYRKALPFSELVIKGKLLLFAAELLRTESTFSVGERQETRRRSNIERLETILAYLDVNLQTALSLHDVAAHFYMNPTYFSEYFKKNVGVGFAEYRIRRRVETAIRLLIESRSSTTEIAMQCGFCSLSAFYASFRRVVGMNPGEYVRQMGTGVFVAR